jgi:hypothetical protein
VRESADRGICTERAGARFAREGREICADAGAASEGEQ